MTPRPSQSSRGSTSLREVARATAFPRGFFVAPASTNVDESRLEDLAWRRLEVADWVVWSAPEREVVHATTPRGGDVVLLGHAYDPWAMTSGRATLELLAEELPDSPLPERDDIDFWRLVDQMAGRFVLLVFDSDRPWILSDPVALQPLYFTDEPLTFAASSHSQLLGEVLSLERDPRAEELVSTAFYGVGIRHLPGVRTPFRATRMVSPNHLLDVRTRRLFRFFPNEPHGTACDWEALVEDTAGTLRRSVELLTGEGDVAVSLSLGTDSRTTLAACRSVADRVTFFSYASNFAEESDAQGARSLCDQLALKHEFYPINVEGYREDRDGEFEALLERNSAGVRRPKLSEIAKIKTLVESFPPGRLELKSHVSEIGRAFYCKKLGVDRMPERLTPRDMSNLYKRNAFNRRLLKWTDEAFAEFREVTRFGEEFYDYEEADMFYWEHRMPQWGALANQDHDIIHDMTTIFNNRRLLVNFLKPSLEDRIADRLHRDVIRHLWPEVLSIPLHVKRSPKARLRQAAERWFFRLNAVPLSSGSRRGPAT